MCAMCAHTICDSVLSELLSFLLEIYEIIDIIVDINTI